MFCLVWLAGCFACGLHDCGVFGCWGVGFFLFNSVAGIVLFVFMSLFVSYLLTFLLVLFITVDLGVCCCAFCCLDVCCLLFYTF